MVTAPPLANRAEYEKWIHDWLVERFTIERDGFIESGVDWKSIWLGEAERAIQWMAETLYYDQLVTGFQPAFNEDSEPWIKDLERLYIVVEASGRTPEISSADIAAALRKEPRLMVAPVSGAGFHHKPGSIQMALDMIRILVEDIRQIALRDPLFQAWHLAILLGE